MPLPFVFFYPLQLNLYFFFYFKEPRQKYTPKKGALIDKFLFFIPRRWYTVGMDTPSRMSPRRERHWKKMLSRRMYRSLQSGTPDIFRPRPRWIPAFVWRRLVFFIVDLDAYDTERGEKVG